MTVRVNQPRDHSMVADHAGEYDSDLKTVAWKRPINSSDCLEILQRKCADVRKMFSVKGWPPGHIDDPLRGKTLYWIKNGCLSSKGSEHSSAPIEIS